MRRQTLPPPSPYAPSDFLLLRLLFYLSVCLSVCLSACLSFFSFPICFQYSRMISWDAKSLQLSINQAENFSSAPSSLCGARRQSGTEGCASGEPSLRSPLTNQREILAVTNFSKTWGPLGYTHSLTPLALTGRAGDASSEAATAAAATAEAEAAATEGRPSRE